MFFVVAGFSHSIADMTYCALAVRQVRTGLRRSGTGRRRGPVRPDLGGAISGNMLPVTLGNTAGGGLVGLAAWYCCYLRKKG